MNSPLEQLALDDRRTTGASDAVRHAILKNPKLFDEIFEAMWKSEDAGVRMRAADVCEHVTQTRPDLLQARKKDLLKFVAPVAQQEVRWRYFQMLPRLKLTRVERRRAFDQLKHSRTTKAASSEPLRCKRCLIWRSKMQLCATKHVRGLNNSWRMGHRP